MQRGRPYQHIGVAQFYPWRPHVAQRDFLLRVAEEYGAQTSELVCNGSFEKCYDKQYQTLGWGTIDHCVKCRLGGGRSRTAARYFVLDWSTRNIPVEGEEIAMLSNRAALVRAELREDITLSQSSEGLLHAYRVAFHSALRWIERFGIDLILLFNGRIDLLKGVMDAARFAGVDFASYERSWFGNGIMLIPFENCLGLGLMHNLCRDRAGIPLSTEEANAAEKIIQRRVERIGSNEWRDFQIQGKAWKNDVLSELGSTPEILVLPSSMYEVWGHPDWQVDWRDNFEALESLQARLGVPWSRWVVRGHPIWHQRVGRSRGEAPIRRYHDFCLQRGIRFVASDSKLHTSALIDACDLVVLNGGSSIIDAVWKGKPVISLAQSVYREAGICPTLLGPSDPIDIPSDDERKEQLIRFIHTMGRIMPTFVNHLVSVSPAEQIQYEGADFKEIVDQVQLRCLNTPSKNIAPVGAELRVAHKLVHRARKLMRTGDR